MFDLYFCPSLDLKQPVVARREVSGLVCSLLLGTEQLVSLFQHYGTGYVSGKLKCHALKSMILTEFCFKI